MNRAIILAILFILITFLTSCSPSVAKTEYDKVVNDLSTANSQSQSLQSQLSDIQNQNKTLQGQISDLQVKNSDIQTQNQTLQTQISDLQAKNDDIQKQLSKSEEQFVVVNTQLAYEKLLAGDGDSPDQLLQSPDMEIKYKIHELRLISDILSSLFTPYLSGQQLSADQQINVLVQMNVDVKATADPQLTSKFNAIFATGVTKAVQDQAAKDFFNYLFQTQSNIINFLSKQSVYN